MSGPEDGIRVIAVAPGYVKTPMIQRSIEAGELDERKLAAMHPLNRLATTQEIAAAHDRAGPAAVPVHDRRGRDHRRRNDIGKIAQPPASCVSVEMKAAVRGRAAA